MKKIFTFMLMLAFALFAGVSCTNDQTGDDPTPEPTPVVPVVTVTGAPEANLTHEAGEFTLNYAVENPATADYVLDITTEATWLTKGEVTETSVTFAYNANTDAPGMPAREAAIVFATEGAESVTVTVKQDTATATFSVEFSEVTPSSASATLTSTDPEIDWIALCYSTSDIANANFSTPIEFINDKLAAAQELGMPYIFMMYQTYQTSGGFGKGSSEYPIQCIMPYSAEPTDKLYMFVIGYNMQVAEDETDTSTLNGPIHVFEVPLLPKPVMTLSSNEVTVSDAEGSTAIDLTIENPADGAYVNLKCEASWVTPTYADGKLTFAYEANTVALPRKATVTVDYVKKNYWGEGEEDFDLEYLVQQQEVTFTQEANANAEVVTFEIEVVEEHNYTHFDRIVVNVKPSNKEVEYVLSTKSATDWGTVSEIDWLELVNQTSSTETNTFKGDLTNHSVILSPANYDPYTDVIQYHVFAFALTADKSAPAGEASHVLATIDTSDKPVLEWVEENGVTKNGSEYKITASAGDKLTLKYVLTGAIEGGIVKVNASNGAIDDEKHVVADILPTVNQDACTVELTISPFDASQNYHYCDISLIYTNETEATWGVTTSTLRITQTEPAAKTLPYEETFAESQGDFAIVDEWLDGISYVWKHDSSYKCMKASAYAGSAHNSESWLISPAIDLTGATAPMLSFDHTHKFGTDATQELTLYVKTVGSWAGWSQLTIENYDDSGKYTFVNNTIDLSKYVGKKIVFGFKYTSTTEAAATWEVKNFVVADAGGAAVMPDMDL